MNIFNKCLSLSEQEKEQIINTGVFNNITEAYARIAMKEAGMKISDIKQVILEVLLVI